MRKVLLSLVATFLIFGITFAQDKLEGVWFNTEKSGKIEIYQTSGKYFGKIIWLDEPFDEDGNPKVNEHSPDKDAQNDAIIGLVILKDFVDEGDGKFKSGTIYDPENGKTYKCKMTLDGDKLDVRGYIGIPALGRTENWTRTSI